MDRSAFDKARIFGYESCFQRALLAKGHLGLVDHSEDLRSRPDFAGDPRAECPDPIAAAWPFRLLELLRSPSLGACIVRRTLGSLAGLVLVIALLGGFVVLYLGKGPIALAGMGTRITHALDERVGHGYSFRVGPVSLTAHGLGPTLAINNLTLVDDTGETIISAPRAEVSVDMVALLFGKVVPKRLEIFGIEMRLELLRDGSLAVSAGDGRKGAMPHIAARRGDWQHGRRQRPAVAILCKAGGIAGDRPADGARTIGCAAALADRQAHRRGAPALDRYVDQVQQSAGVD